MALARIAMGEKREQIKGTDKWESDESFLQRHRLESVEKILTVRKAIWIGHIERSKDEDFKAQMNSLKEEGNIWWKQCEDEFQKYNTSMKDVQFFAGNPTAIKKLFDSSGT